jgi:hypothetical protein
LSSTLLAGRRNSEMPHFFFEAINHSLHQSVI